FGHDAAEVEISMQIWDVLGQKGYSGVQETAMKGAQGVLLVYDVTDEDSRRNLEDYWMPAVWRLAGRVPLVIAGNKSDLAANRMWAEEYLYFLAQKYSCPGLDVRAPSERAIQDLVERLAVVERDFKGPDEIRENRDRRLAWLAGAD